MSRRPSSGDPQDGCRDHRRATLFQGLGVRVDDFRCRAEVAGWSGEEPNPTHSVVFVRRGLFTRSGRDGLVTADVNQVLFFNCGEGYRYGHPQPGGDDCTILALDDERARELGERTRGPEHGGPFRTGHAPASPHAARLHHELLALTRRAGAEMTLAAEEIVTELVEEARRALCAADTRRASPASRRELAEAAKLLLNRSLARPPSLVALAATLGCSPFHLSRTFRAETGLGLRHYVQRVRTRLAAERLARGARDLTALALELGFCDHSHLTNSFRREWGEPPSRLRARRRGEPPGML